MKYAVWFIVICLLWVIPGKDCIAYAEERVIDIIYDNSGSMAFNETDKLGEADNYITRWVEADYAVRAFSALMEEGDKLYVFPMDRNKENVAGTPQENINYFQISSPNDGNIDKASENFGNTYYEGIHNAIAHLQAQSGERWIIILTDSEDKRLCEQALNQELRDVDWVKVLYVPIVEVPERLNLNAEVNNKRDLSTNKIKGEGRCLSLSSTCMPRRYPHHPHMCTHTHTHTHTHVQRIFEVVFSSLSVMSV